METLKEYQKIINLFGKPRKVTITIKIEKKFRVIYAEASCNLFKGETALIEKRDNESYIEAAEYYEMEQYAIENYIFNAQKYKDFLRNGGRGP